MKKKAKVPKKARLKKKISYRDEVRLREWNAELKKAIFEHSGEPLNFDPIPKLYRITGKFQFPKK